MAQFLNLIFEIEPVADRTWFLPVLCIFALFCVSLAWGISSRVSFQCRLDFSTCNRNAHTTVRRLWLWGRLPTRDW